MPSLQDRPPGPAWRRRHHRPALALLTAALTLASTAVTLVVSETAALANGYYNSLHEADAGNTDWMSQVSGGTSLARLSVPGTHDTLALCGYAANADANCEDISTSFTKTQQNFGYSGATLARQLVAGIRSIDIRVRVNKDPDEGMSFTIHHGTYYQWANFTDVLTKSRDFLAAHPRESIFLNLKAECTGDTDSCDDASGYNTDDWRLKVLRGYLEGKAYTGNGTDSKPATNWGSLFWGPSVTGVNQAATPKLGDVRGKIVLMGYRGVQGGIFPGYGLSQLYPAGGSYDEYVQDAYQVNEIDDINDKWEKVRAHLRRTNGVWDLNRPGEREYVYKPDAIYMNYTSGSGSGAHPFTVAGGTPTANGVNEFLIQCLHDTDGRCPEFYADRAGNFGGRTSMERTGIVMMDFPGGELVDDIISRNPVGPDPGPDPEPEPEPPAFPTVGQLRIMPLGDSITWGTGSSTEAGYRVRLYTDLQGHGNTVDFVGSLRSGPAPNAHEGHPSWKIADIAGIADSVLATHRPNVVLLHLGTNDMAGNIDPAGAPARLGGLIDQIFAASPDVTLLVSTIVPSGFPGIQARIAAYNQAVPGVVAARQQAGKHVGLVDMGQVTVADVPDGLHPNDIGYDKMAMAFYDELRFLAAIGWIKPPTGGSSHEGPVQGWFPQGTIASGTGLASGGRIVYADLNGDSRADYVQVNANSSVQAWLNSGPMPGGGDWGWAPQGTIASGVGVPGSQIRFADLNSDRRADFLSVAPNTAVQAWLNSGPQPGGGGDWGWMPQGTIASGVPAPAGTGDPGTRVRLADVTRDGRADYLLVHDNSAVDLWTNAGPMPGGGDWGWTPQGTTASGVGSPGTQIQFADITGDGRADYLDVNPTSGATRAWANVG